ncbi:MAG: hypothetical protein EAX95_09470 [Candidatus Thorarchaeota archaeon]|nr:hypothetical protein [Candidatus Thorarchaeota archaeon]
MDTAKDARVLVLEDALRRLNEVIGNRKLKMHLEYSKLGELLKAAGSLLYEVKYAYTDSKSLADLEATEKLTSAVAEFGEIIYSGIKSQSYSPASSGEKMAIAEVEYSLGTIRGFANRLRSFGDDPGYAVDLIAIEISSVNPVQGSDNLNQCRCTDGSRIRTIVTNIKGLRVGTKLACAILPPAEMMGVLSEAMFLGANALPDDVVLGPLTNPSDAILAQARAQVLQITKRMM